MLLLLTCLVITLSGCEGTETANSESTDPYIFSVQENNTIEFDTLCFNGRLVVNIYGGVEFVSGCTTNADEIQSVIELIENLPIKEPISEEVYERIMAIEQTDNYQIYLKNGMDRDQPEYTITLYEDGIIQFSKEMLVVEEITTEPNVEKYNEVKSLLDDIAE